MAPAHRPYRLFPTVCMRFHTSCTVTARDTRKPMGKPAPHGVRDGGTDLALPRWCNQHNAVRPLKRLAKLMAISWLMAALSLVGWLIVNLDTAGWILVLLTTGLMTFELTRRPARGDGPSRRAKSRPRPGPPTR